MKPLPRSFYKQDAITVAKQLLGKIIRVKYQTIWLAARITETEAYYITDKASHASLGYTEKRKALFMPPGTIYMYYARGGDSLNISIDGPGNAVLIKAAFPYITNRTPKQMLPIMQHLNPTQQNTVRPIEKLCSGQTLLCKALNLKVKEWDQKQFDRNKFYIADVDYKPQHIITAKRLGIPKGRDEHLPYRFIDADFANYCTKKPENQQ